jgi:hypothetical protein
MTQANATRRSGDDFQARLFWLKAARLLEPKSNIARVCFEIGPKGFDDILVQYESSRGPKHHGLALELEHIQCKWHVSPSNYGYEQLIDPEFINADTFSFLQNAFSAQKIHAPDGNGARFRLITNWQINRENPLRKLIHNGAHNLRLEDLFKGGDSSATGKIRKLWREHLKLTDEQLRVFVKTLAISETTDSLEDLRERLDPLFQIAGLRRIPANESAFIYDDVPYKWLGQKKVEFDRDSFRALCEEENLMANNRESRPVIYGVKSFEHATDALEERCEAVLNLVPNFNDRQIRPESDWSTTLYPELKQFLYGAAKENERLRLILDAHVTLTFATGAALDIKSGRIVEIEQRTIGKSIWATDDKELDPSWPAWSFEDIDLKKDASVLAVAISLTHDVKPAVQEYIQRALPNVGGLLIAQPNTGIGTKSVICGRHAFDLAEALTSKIRSTHTQAGKSRHIHLFAACPGGFSFFLGQRHAALGPLTLYEFDFEGGRDASYQPSLILPMKPALKNTV